MSEVTNRVLTEEDILKAKKAKWAAIWDKVTTGLFIALLASPLAILLYIFLWFYLNSR